MERVAIKVTSARDKKPIVLAADDVRGIQDMTGDDKNAGNTKVLTKHNGNFYVEEKAEDLTKLLFSDVKVVG